MTVRIKSRLGNTPKKLEGFKSIREKIYGALKDSSPTEISIADILNKMDFNFPFNPRFKYSIESMMKLLIFMRLKGIKRQTKLVAYLQSHEEDALKLGFFKDENNKLKIPDQRTFSYFIKYHLDDNKKQLIDFVVKTIESVADKFGVVLDAELLENEEVLPKETSEKTFYNRRDKKLGELMRLIKKKIYPRIKLEMRPNSVYNKNDFLDLVTYIALTGDFAENGSKTFAASSGKKVPTPDTLFYHIKKYEGWKELQDMFVQVFDLIFKMAKRGNAFGNRKVDVAIDFTDWLFYGKDESRMIVRKKPERGTSKAFRFATINIVEHGQRFTLLSLPVSTFDTKERIVEKLLSFAKERISIRKLYVDRGFFSSNIINLIKKMGITFIMPAIRNDRIIDYANSVSPPSVIKNYPMKNSRFNLVVLEKEGKRYAFATNMRLSNEDIWLAEKLFFPYSKRWGIETSYRVTKDFRGKTTSRNYVIRLFYFMFSIVLYNLWMLTNIILWLFLFGRIKKNYVITAKLFGTRLLILDPGGGL